MLDAQRMWLMCLDPITGRPWTRHCSTAVAAALLLDLVQHGVAHWRTDIHLVHPLAPEDPLLASGQRCLDRALDSDSALRPGDAIDALHPMAWDCIGRDFLDQGVANQRRTRWRSLRATRYELADRRARTDVVRSLRAALRSQEEIDASAHHLAAVLWATDIEPYALAEGAAPSSTAESLVAARMRDDPLAARLTTAVAQLISPVSSVGGNSIVY